MSVRKVSTGHVLLGPYGKPWRGRRDLSRAMQGGGASPSARVAVAIDRLPALVDGAAF